MAQPSSPLPASSCSSTLVLTPPPLEFTGNGLLGHGLAPKGPLQPHISNLPRRKPRALPVVVNSPRKSRTKGVSMMEYVPPTLRITAAGVGRDSGFGSDSDSDSHSSSESTKSQFAVSPIAIPSLPPILARAGAVLPTPRGVLGKSSSVQRLGRSSGVFLSLGEDDAVLSDVDTIVRILPGSSTPSSTGSDSDTHTLCLGTTSAPRDDGLPTLQPAQLDAVCSFVQRQRRIAVVAPSPEYAADAFSVGLCAYYNAVPAPDRDGVDWEMSVDADPGATRLHRLVWKWHDLPEDSSGALASQWRGLLSRDGLDIVATVLEEQPPRTQLRERSIGHGQTNRYLPGVPIVDFRLYY
ncbi:hypothetical protein C8F01DRAFT_1308728 [Mycena amicta]|nr:hypothetical protein C8F01DRAFT_1308728 [Mycena amicta]